MTRQLPPLPCGCRRRASCLRPNDESTRRTPILQAVQPVIPGDVSNVILYVDTVDTERQTPYAGFYRLGVQTDGRRDGAG